MFVARLPECYIPGNDMIVDEQLVPFGAGAPSDNTCQANQQNMAWKYGGTVTLSHHILWKERSTWEDNLEESGRLAWELLWSETLLGHGWILEEMLSVTTFSQASHLQKICFSNTQPFLEHSDKINQRWNPTMAGSSIFAFSGNRAHTCILHSNKRKGCDNSFHRAWWWTSWRRG